MQIHDIDLAGIVLVPQFRKDFQFTETERLIKPVGCVIVGIHSFFDGFDLHELITGVSGISGCRFEQLPT